jgi:hypothetical protein
MTSHRSTQKNLFAYIKDELPQKDRRIIELHLQSCKDCSDELQSLQATLSRLTDKVKRPSSQRSELYWQQFADKVERRLQDEPVGEAAPSFIGRLLDALVENRKPFGVGFASALSLLILAFAVWSMWIKAPEGDRLASGSLDHNGAHEIRPNIQKTAMEVRADEYLEQSKVLLIGIVNADPQSLVGSRPLLQRQREESKKLVRESEAISAGLTDPSQRRLKELVSDLGVILLQIANLESKHGAQGVEIVRSGVERNGILFKINLEEMQRSRQSSNNKGTSKSAKSTI